MIVPHLAQYIVFSLLFIIMVSVMLYNYANYPVMSSQSERESDAESMYGTVFN